MGRFGLLILMVAGCGHATAKGVVRRSQGDSLRGDLASVRVSVSSSGRVSIHGLDAGGVPVPTRVVAGTDNGPDRGYAIATTEDGEVVAVWYERAAGKSRLQVRRCNRSGHLLWTQAVDGDCTVIDTNGRVDVTRLSGVSGSGIPLLACHSS